MRSVERRVGIECGSRSASYQAEDGIRDLYVTGVQTCALPIYGVALPQRAMPALAHDLPAAHDHRAHDRVRRRVAAAALGELEPAAHEALVVAPASVVVRDPRWHERPRWVGHGARQRARRLHARSRWLRASERRGALLLPSRL